ncbi:GerMN domain-containing protein [Candidatus Peregrinibacteria bacterium]|nr:GerMN domain-containing protein [Candidatus Peregrinibacteria bacterium]
MKKSLVIISSLLLLTACQNTSSPTKTPDDKTTDQKYSVTPLPIKDGETFADENTDTQNNFNLILIGQEDKKLGGKEIGCGDTVVPVIQTSKLDNKASLQDKVTEAYQKLLSFKENKYEGFGYINALQSSNLKLDSLEIKDGQEAIIKLSGDLSLGGACDNPRLQAQLEETAWQFKEIQKINIQVNGKALDSVLSLK